MKQRLTILIASIFSLALSLTAAGAITVPTPKLAASATMSDRAPPAIIPPAPKIDARGYVLMDANSGKILAQKDMDQRMPPASLTKLMTLYIVAQELQRGAIRYDDKVRVDKEAWSTGGSRLFLKLGSEIPVETLVKGIIVASGNDACVAIAKFIAGTQESFAHLMNMTAKQLGMTNSHFTDPTGLPSPEHYSTPHDLAILSYALIKNFPQDYAWYKDKWITFNNIKQPNRNRLLWRDPSVDGIKTGHTQDAGYCLIASGVRDNMRLISVVMGAPSDSARADDSQALLNWGFRFYQSHKIFNANTPIVNPRVWLAEDKTVPMGISKDLYVTLPIGQYNKLQASVTLSSTLKAPIVKGQQYGTLDIKLGDKIIASHPIVALADDQEGGIWTRMMDHVSLTFNRWFSSDKS